ncbi:type 2 isopentenyl-diphosphate Delta-isomerase [Vibrio sp. J1-1]|uniref:type 2 isopentenyl-diphosphate Delta-isomerase n=1 Tax=Vibrio sp. J1-1 TaxID=2912251 RepID=UPI001F01C72A|nr:type 2 isopentenyl-diphosphate Delta-isomerase [Vibrio sp. J1-1]MBR9876302.1 type 2 isopentenyl-diphosphate Delta-isomerase [Vibrionaceae bacterium]MCF7480667.1 type 2 isopentenyl-diphosphate Delta-isomerase [Vibrio sp. J1-1]
MASQTNRKDLHLDAVLHHDMSMKHKTAGFESVEFEHCALPECDFNAIDLSTEFLGRRLALPFLISSMTGGAKDAEAINCRLAEAASELGIAMGVGSQRISLEQSLNAGLGRTIRELAKGVPLYSNLGAAQLRDKENLDNAQRAVDAIQADALIVHVNPMQEAFQANGDHNWVGVIHAIEKLQSRVDVPILVKEVGFGISGSMAEKLVDAGVKAIDVAGAGGTSWSAVEGFCQDNARMKRAAELFRDWGIPTATCLEQIRAQYPALPLIASGGIHNGLEAAKAIHLGANLVGQAGAVLKAATISTQNVVEHFEQMALELRLACFGTGSANLFSLPTAKRL